MTKYSTEAQLYILQARKRLMNNSYEEYAKERYDVYFINNKKITKVQLEDMQAKVNEILASDDFVYDPLSKLIVDEKEFNALDDYAKVRYILELSEIYVRLKKKIS